MKFLRLILAVPTVLATWSQIYKAGHTDSKGHYLGGSEVLHVQGHDGKLFAANGYWEDSRQRTSHGQVLRLDSPTGTWVADLTTDALRTEALEVLTFTTDNKGKTLSSPETVLVAGSFSASWIGTRTANVWVRNDASKTWAKETIVSGSDHGIASLRSLQVYKDSVTGVDRVFVTIGTKGVYSGTWSPSKKAIAWDSTSESGALTYRSLGQAEVNGQLYFSEGNFIHRRNDGAKASWTVVFTMPVKYLNPECGGIRGLSVVPGPSPHGDSLIFVWTPSSKSQGCVIRLDPDGSGGFTQTQEVCLADIASEHLGNHVDYSIGAYNSFLPIQDNSGNDVHLIGYEARIPCTNGVPCVETKSAGSPGGYYSGGIFFIRTGPGEYGLNEVNGKASKSSVPLVAVRTYEKSPFAGDDSIYFGGYDCNTVSAPTNTAWVYRADTATALQPLTLGHNSSKFNQPEGNWSAKY